MCDIADGINDVESTTTQKARKPHTCYGCSETIEKGHAYARTAVLYDGRWSSWKHCLRCSRIFEALIKKAQASRDVMAIDPALDCGESWERAWGEQPPERIAALAFALPSDFAVASADYMSPEQ